MKPGVSEKLSTILRGTQDGDTLHEFDLKLVESAANGILNDLAMEEIDTIQQLVTAGKYNASERWVKPE